MWEQLQQVPWIHFLRRSNGFLVKDARTGEIVETCCFDGVIQFAADRSGSQTNYGLGDLVHQTANAFGFKRCGDCAKRQMNMNRFMPSIPFYRR